MKNLGQMMKQAQELQSKMTEMQAQLGDMEITGRSGGGMVTVTLNGRGEAKKVKIDPKLADGDEVEVLEDLITAAFADAKAKLETAVREKMSELTGGMALPPGFQLPF